MRYRPLGRTDIEVSIVGFGAWPIVGGFNWGAQDRATSLAALRAAYDEGITLFDTAEAYGAGASEELLAEALGSEREGLVIASKVSAAHLEPKLLRQACEASLARLRTDYLDLYQIHWPNAAAPMEETLATLLALRAEGKIRAIGVSNFGVRALGALLGGGPEDEEEEDEDAPPLVSNQLAYSLLFRAVEFEIQPLCVEEGLSILCYSPLLQGLLTGKFAGPDAVPAARARTRHFASSRPAARHGEPGHEALTFETLAEIRTIAETAGRTMEQVAVAWLLAQAGVASALVGARDAEQARAAAACGDVILSASHLRALTAASDPLRAAMGPNPDLWQTPPRIF